MSQEFHREDRYIVIKHKDLGDVPVAYREHLVRPLFALQAHLPVRECVVVESDWPEYETVWRMIEARVTSVTPAGVETSVQAKPVSDCPAERLAQCRGEVARAVVEERTLQDYAIEHAGYLATAADSVQAAYKAYSLAQMNLTEGGDDGEGELSDLVDVARDDLHEALQNLRGMAYEFRKRRDRAIQQ